MILSQDNRLEGGAERLTFVTSRMAQITSNRLIQTVVKTNPSTIFALKNALMETEPR